MSHTKSFIILILCGSYSSQSTAPALQKFGSRVLHATKKPCLTNSTRTFSKEYHEASEAKRAARAILAFGTISSIAYGCLWLHNEDRVHATISNAIANRNINTARLLLNARKILLRDNRPLSQLQYSCPTSIPQCRHNLLIDVKRVIKHHDAPECIQLFKNRTESGDLRQLLTTATAEQRIETEKAILEADSLQ